MVSGVKYRIHCYTQCYTTHLTMSNTNIVCSLKVDNSSAWLGLPCCCPGKQPSIERELYGVSGLEDVVDKINKIFQVGAAKYY